MIFLFFVSFHCPQLFFDPTDIPASLYTTHRQAVVYAENSQGHGELIQWHMVVICIWCPLSVTSQFDVIFMFPNKRFGEVC